MYFCMQTSSYVIGQGAQSRLKIYVIGMQEDMLFNFIQPANAKVRKHLANLQLAMATMSRA